MPSDFANSASIGGSTGCCTFFTVTVNSDVFPARFAAV